MREARRVGLSRACIAPALIASAALLFGCVCAFGAPPPGDEEKAPKDPIEDTASPGQDGDAEEEDTGESPGAGAAQSPFDLQLVTPANQAEKGEMEGQAPLTPLAKPGREKSKGGVSGFLRKHDLFQGVSISGQNTVTLQEHSIEGSQGTFQSQRWDTDNVVRQSSLHLEGPVWKEFVFQADISDNGWGPRYSRWVAGYVGHDTALLYGDLDLRLGGNEFVGFRKSTQGWQVDQRLPGGGFMRGFHTSEKGVTRNQTFVGNDTPGPYFLTFTPIIEGSEIVKVNEDYMKFGKDYRLDYDAGQLWFEPLDGEARIITAADTISVSYQSLGYLHSGPSEIYGLRAEMPLLDDRLLVGLTTLQQDRPTGPAQDTVGYQEDVYYGSGSTGPFDTSFRPIIPDGTSVVYGGDRQIIDRALLVLVDSVEQIEGIDYDSYRAIGRVIFRRAVPPTSLVIIKYYYTIDQNGHVGDQSIWGVDMAYRLSPDVNLSMDWATSSAGGSDGQALSAMVDYSRRDLKLLAEYRDIAPDYSYMDAVGFRRHEKGFNLGGEWRINESITVSDRYSVLDSGSGLSFGYSGYGGGSGFTSMSGTLAAPAQTANPTSLDIATSRNDFGIRLEFDGWPDISLQRNTMSNAGGTSGASDYTTDSVRLNYSPGGAKYSVRASLNRSLQQNLGTTSGSTETTLLGSKSNQFQTSVTVTPSSELSLAASFAKNNSSAIERINESSSENTQLSARWTPSADLSLEFRRTMSETAGRVSSGFFGGYPIGGDSGYTGIPSPGGGTGDDGDGDEEPERPSSEDSSDSFTARWQASDKISLDFNVGRRSYNSTGSQGYLADSVQDYWNVGAMWLASDALSMNLSIGSDDMAFLDEDRGAVENRSFILGANFRPPGKKWSTGLTLNMQNGSSPTYIGYGRLQRSKMVASDLFDISGRFSYRAGEDWNLNASAGFSDYSGGYADFEKTNAEIGATYRIGGNMGLNFGYRYIRHISRLGEDALIYGTVGSGQNYIANTFLLSLTMNFRGGIGGGGRLGSGYGTGSGFTGGPGTFGGYSPSLYNQRGGYGGGYGGQYGGGYGGQYPAGMGSGFAPGGRTSYQTGYGADQFEGVGSYTQERSTGLFGGTGMPWDAGAQQTRRPSRSGGIDTGIGDFRKQDRDKQRGGVGAPAGDETPVGELEDWWLLEDNRSGW